MKKKVTRIVLSMVMFICISVCLVSSVLFMAIEENGYNFDTDNQTKAYTEWLFGRNNEAFNYINIILEYSSSMKDITEDIAETYDVRLMTYQNYDKMCQNIGKSYDERKDLFVSVNKRVDRSDVREEVLNTDKIEDVSYRNLYSMYDLGFIKISVKDYVKLVEKYGIKNDDGEYVFSYSASEELSRNDNETIENNYDIDDNSRKIAEEELESDEYLTIVNSKGNLVIYREGLEYSVDSNDYLYLEYSPENLNLASATYSTKDLLTLTSFNFKEFAIYADYETEEYFRACNYLKNMSNATKGISIKKGEKTIVTNLTKYNQFAYKMSITIENDIYNLIYGNEQTIVTGSISNLSTYTNLNEKNYKGNFIYFGTNDTFEDEFDYLVFQNLGITSEDQNIYLVLAIMSGIIAGVIFIILVVIAGNSKENCTDIENGIDLIYIDILLAILIGCLCVAYILLDYFSYYDIEYDTFSKALKSYVSIIACDFLIVYVSCITFFFSFIRRIKKKTLNKSFFIVWLMKIIIEAATIVSGIVIKNIEKIKGMNRREIEYVVSFIIYVVISLFLFMGMYTQGYEYYDSYEYIISDNSEEVFITWMIVNFIYIFIIYKKAKAINIISDGAKKISDGDYEYKINCDKLRLADKEFAVSINRIGEGINDAVDKSVDAAKQSIKDERLKAELITNVSHDIKTPLTSIINYVDLLKGADLTKEQVDHYLDVLGKKAMRLKMLTEDLVEASKITTGNIELIRVPLDFKELVVQSLGEYEDKFKLKELTISAQLTNLDTIIFADGRRTFRIVENLLSNAYKYSLSGTRVYVSLDKVKNVVIFEMKNISEAPLNIDVSELTERFKRGDESRTTQGSGLGLSIAQSLVDMQDGKLSLSIDGDLFKVRIEFMECSKEQINQD